MCQSTAQSMAQSMGNSDVGTSRGQQSESTMCQKGCAPEDDGKVCQSALAARFMYDSYLMHAEFMADL
jgi:hypothetical protein